MYYNVTMNKRVEHSIAPVYNNESKILMLGTMPSPKSREAGFFYGHPQNRFWKVLSSVLNESCPQTIEEKKEMLIKNKIAVWDVLSSCDIVGADDSTIKHAVPNDLTIILNQSNIHAIFTTGSKAYQLYNLHHLNNTGICANQLLSTSPANCKYTIKDLIDNYSVIKTYI